MSARENIGAHQRHLLRRKDNPLFPSHLRHVDAASLAAAVARDDEERQAFIVGFRQLLEQATSLKPNEESEVLLSLKGRLDEAYTRCASLGGDVATLQQALARLTAVIMNAIRAGARQDPQALQELEQEQLARDSHYHLLEQPLVADLMRPNSPITVEDLVPSLLSESTEGLEVVMWLFEANELSEICQQGRDILSQCQESGPIVAQARRNLERLELLLAQVGVGEK